jgi:hypothetical protein
MDQHQKRERTSEGMIKPEVSLGVSPIAKTQNFTQGGATGQGSDGPGRTWCSLDASLNKAIPDAALEGSGVQWLLRERPTEEDGTVLKTQAVALLQNESYGLHRVDTQILLPWFDVEGRGEMTWTVHLGEARWNKANELVFPPEMSVVTQEGHKLRGPLGSGKGHQKRPLPHKAGKGDINRPVLKNAQDLERVPQRRVSPARGPLFENPAHHSLDERVVSNGDAVNRRHHHRDGGLMDSYGTPQQATIVEVCEVIQHRPQRRLTERNRGSAQEGLEGLPGPFIAIL